jgi:hypothetical protein
MGVGVYVGVPVGSGVWVAVAVWVGACVSVGCGVLVGAADGVIVAVAGGDVIAGRVSVSGVLGVETGLQAVNPRKIRINNIGILLDCDIASDYNLKILPGYYHKAGFKVWDCPREQPQ